MPFPGKASMRAASVPAPVYIDRQAGNGMGFDEFSTDGRPRQLAGAQVSDTDIWGPRGPVALTAKQGQLSAT